MFMLRSVAIANFRSLVDFGLEIPSPYLCLVGDNNVGKSNIVTALKWLFDQGTMLPRGIPSVDLSRTATSLQVSIGAGIALGGAPPVLLDGRRLNDDDGVIRVLKTFVFAGRRTNERGDIQVESDYAPQQGCFVLAYASASESGTGSSQWTPFEHIEGFLPQLVHIRPSDVGRGGDDSSSEGRLANLRWPSELDAGDLDWVMAQVRRLFPDPPSSPPAPAIEFKVDTLLNAGDTGVITFWDDYGYVVPLRKAGSGLVQIVYTLLRIALAKKRVAREGHFARPLVITIDEPEQHLASGMQKLYADLLMDLSAEHQIIVTTHSGLFLKRDVDGATAVLMRGRRGDTVAMPQKTSDTLAVQTTLGVTVEDSLEFGQVSVLVEGPSEVVALPQLLRRLARADKTILNPDQIAILQRDGASRLPPFARLVGQLGLGVLVLADNDPSGRDAAHKIERDPLLAGARVLTVPLPTTQQEEAEFEDLFPRPLLIEVANQHLAHHGWRISQCDLDDLYASEAYWVKKKWSDCLEGVLRAKKHLAKGQKLETVVSKPAMAADLAARVPISAIPGFITREFIPAIEALRAEHARQVYPAPRGWIIPPTRATTWMHPANLVATTDHDV